MEVTMSEFKDVSAILSNTRLAGGSLASQGDSFFAGDWTEFPVAAGVRKDDLIWEIREKANTDNVFYYKDLYQFAQEVKGSPVEMHGINRIMSPQGYGRPEDHSFDIESKKGTTGNPEDYEARIVKQDRTSFDEVQPPRPRRDHTITNMYNYVEPTGQ